MSDRITPAPGITPPHGITDRSAQKLDCGVVAPDVRLSPDDLWRQDYEDFHGCTPEQTGCIAAVCLSMCALFIAAEVLTALGY